MKYIRHVIALVIFLIVAFTAHQLYKMHIAIQESLSEKMEEIFWEAVNLEAEDRLTKLNVPWVSISGRITPSDNSEKKGFRIRCPGTDEFIPYSDSIIKSPDHLQFMFMHQSFLDANNPLLAEVLDSFFRKELNCVLPDASTFIYCYNKTRGCVQFSNNDTLLRQSQIRSPLIKVGMKGELSLQAFVAYPYWFIFRTIWSQAYPFLLLVFLILAVLVAFVCKVDRLFPTVTSLTSAPEEKIPSNHLSDRITNGVFYYRERKLVSSNQNLTILKLFFANPDHTLHHQEIVNALWGNLPSVDHQSRLRKCMQRFRVFLESEFPHAELVSIKGEGYSLFIPEEDFHAPEADVPNAPAPYPDKP